ncbi:hypothetical protein HZB60_02780 [candidate division KSB1 bacterium]|nr:hypothetical protein [candidate division KSB1 bacterium]
MAEYIQPLHIRGRELVSHARYESTLNRDDLNDSFVCGCFHCLRVFFPEEIRQWHAGITALCPHCGEAAVLADSTHLPITAEFLHELQRHVFPACVEGCRDAKRRTRWFASFIFSVSPPHLVGDQGG